MRDDYQSLTEKEKETLRLLVRGYDAKSIARHLVLSVHTINERLRNARQKMSVSSSREAARVLHKLEGGDPDFSADRFLGEAEAGDEALFPIIPNDGHGSRIPLAMLIGGVCIMLLVIATLALSPISQNTGSAIESTQAVPEVGIATGISSASIAAAETETVLSARQWLALVDDYNWKDSWEAAGKSFKELNSFETWASAASKVQPPLGVVLSRTMKSQESVPAPPAGYEIVKFKTSFKNKADALETLALVREDSAWKVVGYWIE